MMSFSGHTKFCPWNWYLACAIAKVESPMPTKEASHWMKLLRFEQETLFLLWYNNRNDANSSEVLATCKGRSPKLTSVEDLNQTTRNLQQYLLII